jgi:DNA-binding GntR family transcriptional regulator
LFVYEASGNPLLAETAQPHWQHMRRVMAAVLSEDDLRINVWDEHEAILRGIESGNPREAEALIREHAEQMAVLLAGRLKAAVARAA